MEFVLGIKMIPIQVWIVYAVLIIFILWHILICVISIWQVVQVFSTFWDRWSVNTLYGWIIQEWWSRISIILKRWRLF